MGGAYGTGGREAKCLQSFDRKRPLGILKHRWQDNMKKGLN